jgi:hypothetical protein
MEKEITKKIRVYGIVQGVGFRSAAMRPRGASVEMSVTRDLMWKFLHREVRRQ